MKFSFKALGPGYGRHGKLTEFSRLPSLVLETPLLLLTTRGASVPHLTHEVLQLLTKDQLTLLVSLSTTVNLHEAAKEYKKGIAHFSGLKDCLIVFAVHDPASVVPAGYNTKTKISVWTHTGRVPVDADKYMDVVEAFQPDIYEILSNSGTDLKLSRKKTIKSVDSSKYLAEACLKRHFKSDVLKTTPVFGVVEGGYELDLRRDHAKCLAQQDFDGFVIVGLQNPEVDFEKINFDDVEPVIKETLKHLPENKVKAVHGCWSPENVLKLIDLGVDLFDSSLPYLVTEKKSALVFKFRTAKTNDSTKSSILDINLTEDKFREDFTPILENCTCLPCTKYTKAYIHHLIHNRELLASTLIMMHNLHHYMEFFKSIRKAASTGERVVLD